MGIKIYTPPYAKFIKYDDSKTGLGAKNIQEAIEEEKNILDNHENTLNSHENTLNNHENTLASHENTLNNHENRIQSVENEIEEARETFPSLDARLDDITSKITTNVSNPLNFVHNGDFSCWEGDPSNNPTVYNWRFWTPEVSGWQIVRFEDTHTPDGGYGWFLRVNCSTTVAGRPMITQNIDLRNIYPALASAAYGTIPLKLKAIAIVRTNSSLIALKGNPGTQNEAYHSGSGNWEILESEFTFDTIPYGAEVGIFNYDDSGTLITFDVAGIYVIPQELSFIPDVVDACLKNTGLTLIDIHTLTYTTTYRNLRNIRQEIMFVSAINTSPIIRYYTISFSRAFSKILTSFISESNPYISISSYDTTSITLAVKEDTPNVEQARIIVIGID